MKTTITSGNTRLYRKLVACIILLFYTSHVFAVTRTWNGGTSSDWNTASNWSGSTVPTSGDAVKIGSSAFTNQPVVGTAPAAVAASITFGTAQAATLTVNSGYTLTVGGAITQKTAALNFGTFTTTLAGSGTITCASITVGDNSTSPPILANNLLKVVSTISSLHVTGNVTVNSTSISILFIGIGLNSANFSLQGGTTLIDGNILTTNTDLGLLPLIDATPTFTVDMPTGSALSPVLQLTNASAINTASVAGSIDFYNNTGGTGTSTVYYNGTSQTVYANKTTCLDNSPQTYQYLVFNGAGTKTVATATGATLSIAKDLTNTATTTDLSAFNPNVSIGNNWINSGNVTGGSGTITAVGLQNSANTITLAGGATTIGTTGIQFTGGGVRAGAGTVTCTGPFLNNGGSFDCGNSASASVIFNGNYTNNSGTFTADTISTSNVYFSGTVQTLQDNTASGTNFFNVQFTDNTATMNSGTGNFSVAAEGVLTMGAGVTLNAGSTTIGGAGYLTLLSAGGSTASIPKIPVSSNIKGNVNVQRYVCGNGATKYRGYRLFSSPVNISGLYALSSTTGYIGLNYLNVGTNSILTAGPSGVANGFSVANTNPLIYLYDESMTTSNTSFVSGKDVGVTAITGLSGSPAYSVTTLSASTSTSGITVPVGNSFLLYYVGSTASSVISSSRLPDNAISTAVGYLNQGDVPVVFWKTGSKTFPYHTNGGYVPGLNQVGNPYPSTISLVQVYADNPTLSPIFWELNDQTGGAYISYNASSGTTSNGRASKYIVSGQGFLAAPFNSSAATITFKEDQKIAYPSGFLSTGTNIASLLLSMPTTPSLTDADSHAFSAANTTTTPVATTDSVPPLAGLHLQLTADSVTNNQTGIYFSSKWADTYSAAEDAVDIPGTSKIDLSSYSSDGSKLGINQLGDYTMGKRIKLYTSSITTGIYSISIADIANIDTGANNIFLIDKKMNDSLDMVHYRSYAFNIIMGDTTTYGANRFVLAIEPKQVTQSQALSFNGQKVTTGVQLDWWVKNPGNYKLFTLQKLGGDNTYSALYIIASCDKADYSCVDKYPITGNNTYRLQQTDMNNNITYSAPVTIGFNSTSPAGNIVIYPNPSKGIISISLSANAPDNYTANIYDTSGKLVKHASENADTFTEDISDYKLGIYIIELKDANGNLLGKSKFVKVN